MGATAYSLMALRQSGMLPLRLPRQVHLRVIEVLLGDFGLMVGPLSLLGRFELSLLSLGTSLLGLTACAGFGLPQTDRRLVSDSLGAGCVSVVLGQQGQGFCENLVRGHKPAF